MSRKLRVLDLFSGIGGFSLGLEMTGGFETVCFVELDPFCRATLRKRWPRVRQFQDVRCVTAARLGHAGVGDIDVVCGGFPCQPYSVAGQRKGREDDRHLWPEMCRVIAQVQPAWVIGENVTGIIPMALDGVLADLESLQYATQPFVIPACAVDARHRRDRVWILGRRAPPRDSALGERDVSDTACNGREQGWTRASEHIRQPRGIRHKGRVAPHADCRELRHQSGRSDGADRQDPSESGEDGAAWSVANATFQLPHGVGDTGSGRRLEPADGRGVLADTDSAGRREQGRPVSIPSSFAVPECGGEPVADAASIGVERHRPVGERVAGASAEARIPGRNRAARGAAQWSPEPGICRVVDGLSGRVHRLKSLGNAVVPQLVAEIGYAILAAEQRE